MFCPESQNFKPEGRVKELEKELRITKMRLEVAVICLKDIVHAASLVINKIEQGNEDELKTFLEMDKGGE